MVPELLERQNATLLGFDIVFAEADDSSGLKRLRQMADDDLKDQPGFAEKLGQLKAGLDYDALFAKSLEKRPVVLGYYFTSDRDGRSSGVLPAPVMNKESLHGRPIKFTTWNGYGANIEQLAGAAPMAGFFNPIVDGDGVVRSIPLVAEYKCRYTKRCPLPIFRMLVACPVWNRLSPPRFFSETTRAREHPAAAVRKPGRAG